MISNLHNAGLRAVKQLSLLRVKCHEDCKPNAQSSVLPNCPRDVTSPAEQLAARMSAKAAAAAALRLPNGTRDAAAAAAASVTLLPLVFRVFSILAPDDFHTFSAAK